VELGHVEFCRCGARNNRNDLAAGRTKTAIIRPILMDREIPRLLARLDELTKLSAAPDANGAATGLTAEQKKEFIEGDGQPEGAHRSPRVVAGADWG